MALSRDLPEYRLRRGDMARLVEQHVTPDGTEVHSAEMLGANGQRLAVAAVETKGLEALRDDGVLSARVIAIHLCRSL